MQLLFLSQIVRLGDDFHSMKSNFFADIVVMLNTKHLFLKQSLANINLGKQVTTLIMTNLHPELSLFFLFLISFAEVGIEAKNKEKQVSNQ